MFLRSHTAPPRAPPLYTTPRNTSRSTLERSGPCARGTPPRPPRARWRSRCRPSPLLLLRSSSPARGRSVHARSAPPTAPPFHGRLVRRVPRHPSIGGPPPPSTHLPVRMERGGGGDKGGSRRTVAERADRGEACARGQEWEEGVNYFENVPFVITVGGCGLVHTGLHTGRFHTK